MEGTVIYTNHFPRACQMQHLFLCPPVFHLNKMVFDWPCFVSVSTFGKSVKLCRKDLRKFSVGTPWPSTSKWTTCISEHKRRQPGFRGPHRLWPSLVEEPRMEGNVWKVLVVTGALSLSGTSSLPHKPLIYNKAVELGVAIYNSKAGEDSCYRLLEAVPQPAWDPSSESNQVLNFTMKETMCSVEDVCSLEECDFQEDGVVRQCRGYYFFEERPPVVVITCVTVVGLEKEERAEEEEEEEKKEGKEAEEKEEEKDQPKWVKRFLRVFQKLKKDIRKLFKKEKMVTGPLTS